MTIEDGRMDYMLVINKDGSVKIPDSVEEKLDLILSNIEMINAIRDVLKDGDDAQDMLMDIASIVEVEL